MGSFHRRCRAAPVICEGKVKASKEDSVLRVGGGVGGEGKGAGGVGGEGKGRGPGGGKDVACRGGTRCPVKGKKAKAEFFMQSGGGGRCGYRAKKNQAQ